MKLVVLASAQRDLLRLQDFLEAKNPRAAREAIRVIRVRSRLLIDNPEIGRRVVKSGFRDLLVPFGRDGYILRYQIEGDEIRITRIWHGREDRGTP